MWKQEHQKSLEEMAKGQVESFWKRKKASKNPDI